MRVHSLALGVALVFWLGPLAHAQERATVGPVTTALPLWLAAREGRVHVAGRSKGSHDSAHLAITNAGADPVVVDVNASFLAPVHIRTAVQPLGLGLIDEEKKGTTEVLIEAHGTRAIDVLTVCMDQAAHSPDGTIEFCLAPCEAPTPVANVLKNWRAHPELDQGSIQSKVWEVAPPHLGAPPPPRPSEPCDLPAATKQVAVAAGVVFALGQDGVLREARAGEAWSPVAASVVDVVADAEGAVAVLARTRLDAEPGVARSTGETWCVARRDATRGRWTDVLETARGGRLLWAGRGAALLEQGDAVCLHTRERVTRVAGAGAFVLEHEHGAVVLAPGEDPKTTRVVRLERKAGEWQLGEGEKLAVDVRAAAATGGKLYLATADARLLDATPGDAPRELRVPWDLEANAPPHLPARACRSVRASGASLVVDTEGGGVLRVPGDGPAPVEPAADDARFASDPAGLVYSWSGDQLCQLDAHSGRWVRVKFIRYRDEGVTLSFESR